MQTQNEYRHPNEKSSFVVSLASRARRPHPIRTQRADESAQSSRIYFFPIQARRVAPAPLTPAFEIATAAQPDIAPIPVESIEAKPPMTASAERGRIAWTRRIETRHALWLGAAACYALIIFNFVYGLSSLARMKPWPTLPIGYATDSGPPSQLQINLLFGSIFAPVVFKTEPVFDVLAARRWVSKNPL